MIPWKSRACERGTGVVSWLKPIYSHTRIFGSQELTQWRIYDFAKGRPFQGWGRNSELAPPTESRGVRGVLVGGLGYKLMLFCDSAVRMVWTLVKIEGIYYLDVMCTNDERQNCRKPGTHYEP